MLYLVSTPIGNLEDITFRAVKILSSCDYILCEDTRKSKILLDHLKIDKKLVSFHKFSEKKKEEEILKDLEEEKKIALISDGGTPVINDPGFLLVRQCQIRNLKVTAIPGPCSLIDALVLSGLDSSTFQFIGFLPKKSLELENLLKKILHYSGLTLCFESPKRIISTLQILEKLDKERDIVLTRELTKTFEEVIRGTPSFLINHFLLNLPKGELVLIISKKEMDFKDMDLETMLFILKEYYGLSSKEALKLAAKLRKEPKNILYKQINLKD